MANGTCCVASCKYGGDVKKHGKKDLVRCCLCMKWHHGDCLPRDEEIAGIWNCPKCRLLPQLLADMTISHSELQKEMQAMSDKMQAMSNKQSEMEDGMNEIKDQCAKLREENINLLAKLENALSHNVAASSACAQQSIDSGSNSWTQVVKSSVRSALQDEQSKSEIVLLQMPEKKSDSKDLQALCSKLKISVRPSAVVRLGNDAKKGPRPMKVTFSTPFDARIFLTKAVELKNDEDDCIKKIRCRPCRSRDEQTRYLKLKAETRKLNEKARADGVHETESFSLRTSGQIWKYARSADGSWKRVTEWESTLSPDNAVNEKSGN